MKLYYISEQSDPGKINLDDLLNRYRNYDFHFYTEYLSEEGIFTYELKKYNKLFLVNYEKNKSKKYLSI